MAPTQKIHNDAPHLFTQKYDASSRDLHHIKQQQTELFELHLKMSSIESMQKAVASIMGIDGGHSNMAGMEGMYKTIEVMEKKNETQAKIEQRSRDMERAHHQSLLDKLQELNACIDQEVKVDSSILEYSGSGMSMPIEYKALKTGALDVAVFYKDQCIFKQEVTCKQGENQYTWSGYDNDGIQAVQDVYTVKFTPKQDKEQRIETISYHKLNDISLCDGQLLAICDNKKVCGHSIFRSSINKPPAVFSANPCSLIQKNITVDCSIPTDSRRKDGTMEVRFISPRALNKNEKCFAVLYNPKTNTEITREAVRNLQLGYNNITVHNDHSQPSADIRAKVVIVDEDGEETKVNNEHSMEVRGISNDGYVLDEHNNAFPINNITSVAVASDAKNILDASPTTNLLEQRGVDQKKLDDLSSFIGSTVECPVRFTKDMSVIHVTPRALIQEHQGISEVTINVCKYEDDKKDGKKKEVLHTILPEIPSSIKKPFSIAEEYKDLCRESKSDVNARIKSMSAGVFSSFKAVNALDPAKKIEFFTTLNTIQKESGIWLSKKQEQEVKGAGDEKAQKEKRQEYHLENRGLLAVTLPDAEIKALPPEHFIEMTITTASPDGSIGPIPISNREKVRNAQESDEEGVYLLHLASGGQIKSNKINGMYK
ncbi:hypothetical protein Sarmat_00810 [Rickettsiales endosymbiont of Paramecium tredecaurelia]|uniref:hypothetical protein n=1 Tax=Candidatus Sarmatiella mevalonica TaxID=2770581 RepID=UPI001920D72B|nr:hypothetical protein [Candidatus Sarmatiella mevalonica]MBL3284950.1 hypothetical protein [Candidatus Sarmatiella mevalonica]